MGKFYTFRKVALKYKAPWQKLRFTRGKGYWLFGKPPVVQQEFTMYDSVNISQIPANAVAVAGYVNGHWPTYPSLEKSFPNAKRLSIAVTVHADAECLDVEEGDATPAQAPEWVVRQKKRGVAKPVVYTSVSQAPALLRELDRAGIKRSAIRLWTAHYTFKPHRCDSKCGFGFSGTADATQWTDKALGKNLDGSLCAPDFL
jgi:hypothetical protein